VISIDQLGKMGFVARLPTAEKHYRPRPLDLLRLHAERFEAWILEQAGIEFDPAQQPGALRVVAGGEA